MIIKNIHLLLILLVLTSKGFAQKIVTVAVAANAQFAMKEIKKNFEKETGIHLELIINSSGKITAQVKEGAPFDIFLSADTQFPDALYKEGLATTKPEIYAYGSLVLWSMSKLEKSNIKTLLLSDKFDKVAIANPKLAPYGEAAIEILNYYNIYKTIETRIVNGESISQVNQYVVSGAADLGFTAKSVVLSPEMKDKGTWIEIDAKSYSPIAQGVVLLKKNQEQNFKEAEQFYKYLFTEKAKSVFRKYGYSVR
ncbi:molybdenum ABC transporter, periplasmic molybdenum-binding protein ModA [Sporocytophaga myxococcoides]|uniref:Molybdenum ABC transporter, periplasmic molybdenum-binding protein ModA n=1 Tax=Sporocytophaga myxococcoides TaxID=153721 RepID=A0A098LD75_9BACT|nr:molybdate ABC transporter substrate-binding protein [Sporocytophaga myxococcoides]GAL84367.1 molybdenum ABC transporter, periplasmic molybdenum-binding protein ModA [Sporocytophaga myxococcoides]